MTDAESFYDKLLASLAIPGLEIGPRNEPEKRNPKAETPVNALERQDKMNGLSSGNDLAGVQDSSRRPVVPKSPTETRDFGLGEEGGSTTTRRDEVPPGTPSLEKPNKPQPPANLPPPEQPKSSSTGALKVRTSAALEAELRRRLLESGLKRKSFSESEENLPTKNAPAGPENRAPEPDPPGPDKAAELRRRLLFERNAFEKQKSSAQNVPSAIPLKTPTKPARSQSPISISSDDEDLHTTKSLSHPISLPPRPPPRIGFRLRISVPFVASASGYLVMQTEKLPLSTTLTSIIEIFGPANEGDHLYFPHSKPKPSQSATKAEGDGERQGEDSGQRFYYEPEDSEIEPQEEATGQPAKAPTKKPNETRPRSVKSSLNGGASDFVPAVKKEKFDEPRSWAAGRKTLEDVWTGGKQEVECVLNRAGELDHHEQGQEVEMYTDGEYFQQNNGWGGMRDFPPPGKPSEGEPHGQWGFGASGFPPDNMSYGYPNQQWAGPYLDPNMPSPSTPWFPPQQNFPQQSPVFPPPQQPQPDFSPEGGNGPQAMHWIPGHTDYTTAGWMYGFNGTAEASVSQESPTTNEAPIPPITESRGVPGSVKKRIRGGRRKKDRGKPGPISSPGVTRTGRPSHD
ncbi:hypothetical protein L873DRAFT_1693436 [Choiromyces venosus 120613-1]|uniref:Uncharacterized protein n=1 Tax=Choiromyces venosus 120613-1 TaxID=1336337 RepID=A0A3N4JID6_9PEZI|nr:hypothetical protein L873DRAFT_1693436 [Choiromyces venosus 120613-1]